MTQDELRQKCIEAMAREMTERFGWHHNTWTFWLKDLDAAFDSLHGIVRVVPVEATEEMCNVYWRTAADKLFAAMAAAGDLTRPR